MKRISVLLFLISLSAVGQDTLRPIAPKGYVLLTYDGARLAIQKKIEADACAGIVARKDTIISLQGTQIFMLDQQILRHQTEILLEKQRVQQLKQALFWKNVETWTLRIVTAALLGKAINLY